MLRSSALLLALATALADGQPARAGFSWILPATTSGEGYIAPSVTYPGDALCYAEVDRAEASYSDQNQGFSYQARTFTFLATFELSGSPGGWEIGHSIALQAWFERSTRGFATVSGRFDLIEGTGGAVLDSLTWRAQSGSGPGPADKADFFPLTLADGLYSLRGEMNASAEIGGGEFPGTYASAQFIALNELFFQPVPEPGSIALAILGGSILLGGRAISGRRRDRPVGADAPPSGTSSHGGRSGRR